MSHQYDYEAAERDTRAAMKKTDLMTIAVVSLAQTHAACVRENFPDEELPIVVRQMLHGTACLGRIVKKMPSISVQAYSTANVILNVQACAAVLILDQLEIEALEASLRAES